MTYAKTTSVPVDRTQTEIKRILTKYGATGFVFGESDRCAMVIFEMQKRRIKIILPLPHRPSEYATGASIRTYEQLCRSSWRCLALVIKAKLESVESKITTLEQEFLAHILLPDGRTMGQVAIPQIGQAYTDGKMPPLLGYQS